MDKNKTNFSCDEKCRICPYPGANCKKITVKPELSEREVDKYRTWMDREFQDEVMKKMHLK